MQLPPTNPQLQERRTEKDLVGDPRQDQNAEEQAPHNKKPLHLRHLRPPLQTSILPTNKIRIPLCTSYTNSDSKARLRSDLLRIQLKKEDRNSLRTLKNGDVRNLLFDHRQIIHKR